MWALRAGGGQLHHPVRLPDGDYEIAWRPAGRRSLGRAALAVREDGTIVLSSGAAAGALLLGGLPAAPAQAHRSRALDLHFVRLGSRSAPPSRPRPGAARARPPHRPRRGRASQRQDDEAALRVHGIRLLDLLTDDTRRPAAAARPGVAFAAAALDAGGGALIDCQYGIGRSASSACASLSRGATRPSPRWRGSRTRARRPRRARSSLTCSCAPRGAA